MKFRTAYSSSEHQPSPAGSRYRKKYIKSFSDNGTPVLVQDGIEDVYDSIQKAAPGNVIEDLIRRAQSGDDSAIPQPVDSFVDLTGVPKDMLEANAMLSKAKESFLKLPPAIRSRYSNNFSTFMEAVQDGSFQKDMTQLNHKNAVAPLSADEIQKIRSSLGGEK